MAARRDRERRRPAAERRYRFASPEAALEPDELELANGEEATEAVETPPKRARADHQQDRGLASRRSARSRTAVFGLQR